MKQIESAKHELAWSERLGKQIPNVLTLLRVLVIPLFVALLIDPVPPANLWAAGIFIVASITDWLDGYLARLYRAESILGTVLDPLADKILVMAALVMLAAAPSHSRISAWMAVLLLAREMLVTGLRSLAAIKGVVLPASRFAKHKTAWTMVAISFLLIDEPYKIFLVLFDFHNAGVACLWIALVLSLTTGIAYAVQLRKLLYEML